MPQQVQNQGFNHPIPSEITPRAAYLGRTFTGNRLAAGPAGQAAAQRAGGELLHPAASAQVDRTRRDLRRDRVVETSVLRGL